jgi:hypothetical protein
MSVESFMTEYAGLPAGRGEARLVEGAYAKFRCYLGKDYVHFVELVAVEPMSGTKAMKHICQMADRHQVRLEGHVHSFPTEHRQIIPNERLCNWYRGFGFKTIGKEKVPESGEVADKIIREPK